MSFDRGQRWSAVGLALLVLGCTEGTPTTPETAEETGSPPRFSLLPEDVFGIGPSGSEPCSAGGYRQFDFWVGNWDVYGGTSTTLQGTNQVISRLNGCMVEENWVGAFGGTGRSLNAYDHGTDTWSQMWVAPDGCPFSVILMEGGFADGSMTMFGRREQPLGFLIGPPCGPPPPIVVSVRTHRVRWTALPSGSVLQQLQAANDDAPLPPLQLPPDPNTGLRYDQVDVVTPLVPRTFGSFCPFRAAAQQFNFMIGTWAVHQGQGNGAQGSATFSKDQLQCLVEEHFSGLGGYQGISFNTFDVFTQQWVRTWVDNQGQRLFLTGGLVDGAMVLRGTKRTGDGHEIVVRVSWTPVSADEVIQTWSFSRNGGESWQVERTLRYTRN